MFPHHKNDPEFVNALVDSFLEISAKSYIQCTPKVSTPESNQQVHESSVSKIYLSSSETVPRNLSDFPDARPGYSLNCIHFLCDITYHWDVKVNSETY